MENRKTEILFRSIGIGIAVLVAFACGIYIYACYKTAFGEFGMFFLPIVAGLPLITLESITFSVKFFVASRGSRTLGILKCVELFCSGTALLCAVLAFVDGLAVLMGVAIFLAVIVPILWIIELCIRKRG